MSEKKTRQLIQLFYRETERVRLIDLDYLPELDVKHQDHMNQWLESKRNFSLEEVYQQVWLKTCSAGYITELYFHADGSVDEYTLFNRLHTQGYWQLVDGVIEVTIYKNDNTYQFAIIANQFSNIHSAIEYKNQQLHSYLKVAQIKPI
ncbi:TPA: hypothetical protein ACX6Q7_001828 [Photobacterium damselae]